MSHLTEAVSTVRERLPNLEKAERYYNGDWDEVFGSERLRAALKRTSANFRVNFTHVVVDAVLNRLDISTIHVTDDLAGQVIENVWVGNELNFESNEVHRNTLIYGDAYVMVWLNEEDEIEVTYNSPKTVHLFYEDENPRRKKYAAKVWVEEEKTRVNLYYPDRIEKYISKVKTPKKDGDFSEFKDDEDSNWPAANPFGVIPVFHFRTRRPFGRPEHADAYGPQDMINKIVITQMATNDYHGFPQRYALANPEGAGTSNEFDDFADDSDTADPEATLSSGPGQLWYLKGVQTVGQFDPSDADAFLDPFREYVKALAAVTDTPYHHFENPGGNQSGESLRAAEAPLIKKVRNRQALFGQTWTEVFDFILALVGITETRTAVKWEPVESVNTKDAWEVAAKKLEVGVPFAMVMAEQGYSDEEIEQMLQERLLQQNSIAAPILDEFDEPGPDEV